MTHLSWEELAKRQREAQEAAPIGTRYEHHRTGGMYEVSDHAIEESCDEAGVLYRNVDHPDVTFFRPLSRLLDRVLEDGEEKPRFRRVD